MSLVLEDPPFSIDVAWSRNTATVALSGEVDVATASELEDCLADVATNRPDWLVVDLTNLHFIDCSGAAVLARARDALVSAGCRMVVRSPNRLARMVLRLTGLEGLCQGAT